jgi:hypothetical protein
LDLEQQAARHAELGRPADQGGGGGTWRARRGIAQLPKAREALQEFVELLRVLEVSDVELPSKKATCLSISAEAKLSGRLKAVLTTRDRAGSARTS